MGNLWQPISGVYWKSEPYLPDLNWSVDYWSLFTTIIGALAGAWLGAWAAQKIAKTEKKRDEASQEVRSINAGIILAYNICNIAMSLKKQHLRNLKKSYDNDLSIHEAAKKMPPPREIHIKPQMMYLGAPITPIDELKRICLDKISSNSLAIHAAIALSNAINNLNSSISTYNSQIDLFRRAEFPPGFQFEHLYLGIPVNGSVNNFYGDTLNGLCDYNDDVIFFALVLCDKLQSLGDKIIPDYEKQTGRTDTKISKIDITDPILDGLVPQHERYESWLSGFKTK
ncbi:hypothetical protein [Pseudomonas asiatica]|uniref:Uncharacterized protein n=1 Tax=Pseudomonas asiatica TaxID=2219225 RepID=A0ABU5L588_9PSED|nr:hypothetical protein [Pseudomonas asiatica]MDZ5741038.1 hypothetical protein [Pseudomonas asiatica]MDZ5745939.1 hypothetical protein [Pseudomonas asiatica]MDZ5750507.1 hypothetical protein [Pseudomonas asiatica]MDZ5756389.1 hypothetical protein [Pseudomonas asiatica]